MLSEIMEKILGLQAHIASLAFYINAEDSNTRLRASTEPSPQVPGTFFKGNENHNSFYLKGKWTSQWKV